MLSKGIQNELIDVVGNSSRSTIIAEVQQAKLYSIIADEVTDVANKEELSLVLRYVTLGINHAFLWEFLWFPALYQFDRFSSVTSQCSVVQSVS